MEGRYRALLEKTLQRSGLEWCQLCDAIGAVDEETFWVCHECEDEVFCCGCSAPVVCWSCEEYICKDCLVECSLCDTAVCLSCELECPRCLSRPWCGACAHGCREPVV